MRYFVLLALLACGKILYGQSIHPNNRIDLTIDYSAGLFTAGDFLGFDLTQELKVPVHKFISIAPSLSLSYAAARALSGQAHDPRSNYLSHNHPGPPVSIVSGDRREFNDGLHIFESAHLDRSFYASTALNVVFGLYREKNLLEVSLGPSLAYIDYSYVAYITQGVFSSGITGSTDVILIGHLYHRYLDLGYNVQLRYAKYLSPRFSLGGKLGFVRWESGDHQNLSIGISTRFHLGKKGG